jgi:hypothetical protein
MRRRAAVEPVIGHMKAEHRMGRNYLKGRDGGRINAVLAAAGYNFRLLLRWLERLLRALIAALLTGLRCPQTPNDCSSTVLHGRLKTSNTVRSISTLLDRRATNVYGLRPHHAPVPASAGEPIACRGRRQGMDFRAHPAAAAVDGLILIFFWRAGAVLVGSDDGAVDHRIFVVGIGGQAFEHALPNPVLGPAAEPPMCVLPAAKALGQVAPRNSSAIPIEHRFDKPTIVMGGRADAPGFPWEQVFDALPLIVARIHIASWDSPVPSRLR